ncbi:hypothetical protein FA95DRAFT_1609110 [Auriscalpium vulgare]|uniref:Uncharacterized protein n=1 Tax=Auriscalpium vulgare TaxID=40419 RepID=A0ACB8RJ78_9AGAM|nr:hypothetical protein FA95DRAFT_1609110 [Auriscalpium vulgare]
MGVPAPQLRAGTPPQSPTAYNGTLVENTAPEYEPVQTPFERPRKSRRRGIIKALIVTLLIWTLIVLMRGFIIGVFTHSLIKVLNNGHFDWRTDRPSPMPESVNPSENVDHCVHRAQWGPLEGTPLHREPERSGGFWATAEFELPLEDGDKFTFWSRGARAHGGFHVVESSDVRDVVVIVDAYYYKKSVLRQAQVCTTGLHRDSHQKGLAIFAHVYGNRWPLPGRFHRKRELEFYVTVMLPSSSTHSVRHIPQFTTMFHDFAQRFDDLSNFSFDLVSLNSTNGPIAIENIVAESLTAETTNGPITGKYNTTSHLRLVTSNSPIKVGVTASDDGKKGKPTTVNLHTTNSALQASMYLVANTTNGTGGVFSVEASTTNSPLKITILDAPPDSALHLTAHTTNEGAVVNLHPSYEGSITASTTNFAPSLRQLPFVQDPSGAGRPRGVELHNLRGRTAYGSVWWVPSQHQEGKAGSVSVWTTNSPVKVTV